MSELKELKPKKIKVNGKPVTVFKAPFVNGLQRSIRIAEAGKEVPKFYENSGLSVEVIRYIHQLLFPSLISCSEGTLPTEEKFLKLYDEEITAWINAAQELNKDWFSLNGENQSDVEKKAG